MNSTSSGAPSEKAAEELRELSSVSSEQQNKRVEFRMINGDGEKTTIQYPEFGDRVRAITGIEIKIVNEPKRPKEEALIKALTEDDPGDFEEREYKRIREKLVSILLDES